MPVGMRLRATGFDLPALTLVTQLRTFDPFRYGNVQISGFCPTCGSQVTAKLERLPDICVLQVGSLDDPSTYRPMMDAYTSSAQPLDHMDPEIRKHAKALPRRPI
jgi:hypothetical protein